MRWLYQIINLFLFLKIIKFNCVMKIISNHNYQVLENIQFYQKSEYMYQYHVNFINFALVVAKLEAIIQNIFNKCLKLLPYYFYHFL